MCQEVRTALDGLHMLIDGLGMTDFDHSLAIRVLVFLNRRVIKQSAVQEASFRCKVAAPQQSISAYS